MFDIGFTELLLLAVVGLLVLGPERLPEAARTFGVMAGKLRRSFDSIRNEVHRELEMDEIRTRLEKERQKMGLDQIRESWEEFARQSGQDLNQISAQKPDESASKPAVSSPSAEPTAASDSTPVPESAGAGDAANASENTIHGNPPT